MTQIVAVDIGGTHARFALAQGAPAQSTFLLETLVRAAKAD
jgi:glucokinase